MNKELPALFMAGKPYNDLARAGRVMGEGSSRLVLYGLGGLEPDRNG